MNRLVGVSNHCQAILVMNQLNVVRQTVISSKLNLVKIIQLVQLKDVHFVYYYYYYYYFNYFTHSRVLHTSVTWLFSTWVKVTASILKSPGLFLVFWPISTMYPVPNLWWLYGAQQLQLVSPSLSCSIFFFSFLARSSYLSLFFAFFQFHFVVHRDC